LFPSRHPFSFPLTSLILSTPATNSSLTSLRRKLREIHLGPDHGTPRSSNLTELALPGFLKPLPGRLNTTSKKRDLLLSSAVLLDKACSNCKRAKASCNRTAARGPAILSFIGVLFRVHILLDHFVQQSSS